MKRSWSGIGLTILLLVPAVVNAQILVVGDGPVVYGHHHLNTTNMDAQKKFFVDTLGGSVVKIGSADRQQEIIKFPNVLIFFRAAALSLRLGFVGLGAAAAADLRLTISPSGSLWRPREARHIM